MSVMNTKIADEMNKFTQQIFIWESQNFHHFEKLCSKFWNQMKKLNLKLFLLLIHSSISFTSILTSSFKEKEEM